MYADPAGYLAGPTIAGLLASSGTIGGSLAFAGGFGTTALSSLGEVTVVGTIVLAGAVIGAGMGMLGGAIAGAIGTGTWAGTFEGAANVFMIGSITGAVSGDIRGGINYARTTPLIRSVSSDEFSGIKNTGSFSSNRSMESKWFATNKGNVASWANSFGQSDYVGIRVLKSSLNSDSVFYSAFLDNIGPAYCIDMDYLNTIVSSMWFF